MAIDTKYSLGDRVLYVQNLKIVKAKISKISATYEAMSWGGHVPYRTEKRVEYKISLLDKDEIIENVKESELFNSVLDLINAYNT